MVVDINPNRPSASKRKVTDIDIINEKDLLSIPSEKQ
jgi:hypothetical protein